MCKGTIQQYRPKLPYSFFSALFAENPIDYKVSIGKTKYIRWTLCSQDDIMYWTADTVVTFFISQTWRNEQSRVVSEICVSLSTNLFVHIRHLINSEFVMQHFTLLKQQKIVFSVLCHSVFLNWNTCNMVILLQCFNCIESNLNFCVLIIDENNTSIAVVGKSWILSNWSWFMCSVN